MMRRIRIKHTNKTIDNGWSQGIVEEMFSVFQSDIFHYLS